MEFKRIAYVVGFIAVACFVAWQSKLFVQQHEQQKLVATGKARVTLYSNSLLGELRKYQYLPNLLSKRSTIEGLLQWDDEELRDDVNRYLESVSRQTEASVIFVMNTRGLTVASSNWRQPLSFVGRNYHFRPYFTDAMAGKDGRYFAVGVTTKTPGFFLSKVIGPVEQPLGVVVIKVAMDVLQDDWAKTDENVIVTDDNSVVIMSSRETWRYTTLKPLHISTLDQITTARQYDETYIKQLGELTGISQQRDWQRLKVYEQYQIGDDNQDMLLITSPLPGFDWQVKVLMELNGVYRHGNNTFFLVIMAFALLGGVLFNLYQRQQHMLELEERVDERTQDLTHANKQLRQEISDRERAEKELRSAHEELLQASKLAALGQMSAAIAHELNQPLDAIQTFAASTSLLIKRQRYEDVDENIRLINELTKRMARITEQLRNFARRGKGSVQLVQVSRCVERCFLLMGDSIREQNVSLHLNLPEPHIYVLAEEIGFEQVLINLISNALEAMQDCETRTLVCEVMDDGEYLYITLSDSGSGITDAHKQKLFEPFFTTRESKGGLGLGLALCQRTMKYYGGAIRLVESSLGGASFEVSLPLVSPDTI